MPTPADPRQQDDSSEANAADRRAFAPVSGRAPCLQELDSATRIVVANAGDQPLVLGFLEQVQQANLQADFPSRLDHPNYQPSDRQLLRHHGEIIGHVQVSGYTAWFGGERLPTATLTDLHVLPEFGPADYASKLLASAETIAAQEGAALALTRTDRLDWFSQRGWTRLRGQGHTQANTRAVLAHLEAQEGAQRRRKRKRTLEVATWRHFELEAIRELYDQLAPSMWGVVHRSEAWWQWLAGRKSHDQILLVRDSRWSPNPQDDSEQANSDDHDRTALESSCQNVVGYAVVRDSCLVEVFTLPGYEAARSLLLKRACQDAIDRNHNFVALHTSADDPLHELLVTAGGNWIRDALTPSGCWMAKLLDPQKWVEKLYPVFHARARAEGITRPVEIDYSGSPADKSDAQQRFVLTRRSARLETVAAGETHKPVAAWPEMQDLLLSNRRKSNGAPALEVGDDELAGALSALFPHRSFWQSPYESIKL